MAGTKSQITLGFKSSNKSLYFFTFTLMKRHLNNKTYNYYTIIIVALITTTIALNLDYSNAGMAAIVVVWLPLVFSVITGLVYYLSHYILKECHWLVTLIGSLFVIYLTVGIALTDFTT